MARGLIHLLTARHPIRLTSTRCRSSRRLNPGRRSTYPAENAVQTIRATSPIAGEVGDVEVPLPQAAAGQHRPTRTTFPEPRSAEHGAGFFVRTLLTILR